MEEKGVNTRITDDKTLLGLLDELSNEGRWGADDRLGTLNLIDQQARIRAASAVRKGVSVDLSRPISPKATRGMLPAGAVHFMMMTGTEAAETGKAVTTDWFGMPIHGFNITHLDALSHVLWDGRSYNGIAADSIEATRGATDGGVDVAVGEIVTRAVLLDLPVVQEVDYLDRTTAIMPEDLEAAEVASGVKVVPGDALIVRTGCDRWAKEREELGKQAAGLHASCLPWLRERGVSVLISDATHDVRPSGFVLDSPIHIVGISRMGLWLVDNADLERVSAACVEHQQWDMLLSIAPLNLKNSTGSPVSPTVVL